MHNQYHIDSEAALERIIGEPMEFVRAKVIPQLDTAMREFIQRAPLLFVATTNSSGQVDVSPKGDPPGFVHIESDSCLLIPERPGNRLTFGFRNILNNGEIGLIFLAPHQREMLRVRGHASLHCDPGHLEAMTVKGKPALMYTRVEISECFFHCGKAVIRSRLWQPNAWTGAEASLGARSFAETLGGGGENALEETEQLMDHSYKNELY